MISIKKIIRRILFPQSLQKLDRLFLLYRPRLWALKLHYICYHALLVNILIVFLTLIFPIPIYDLYSFSTIGFVIIGIGAFIVIFAWFGEQYTYNIEAEYGNFRKINAYLEILGYSVCIALVTLASIVFFLLMELKVAIVIPQTELSIDLLMLETISAKNSLTTNIETIDEYIIYINNYLGSNEFKLNQSNSIFSSKYDKQDKRNTYWNNITEGQLREDWMKIVLKNDLLRSLLKKTININNLILLEYDKYKGYINNEVKIDKDIFAIFGFDRNIGEIISPINQSVQYTTTIGAIFKYWEQQNNKLIEKTIKNSILTISLELVEKEKILSIVNKYTNLDVSNKKNKKQNFTTGLSNARTNASDLYERFYHRNFLGLVLFLNYLILVIAVLLVFLFKYTYFSECFSAISTICIYPVGVGYISPFLDSFSWFSKLNIEIKISLFVALPTLFVFYQVLNPRKIDRYSELKTINLVIFPFALDISAFAIVNILFPGNQSISVNMKLAIASLFHLPFIPYLKGELVKQLSLPK